MGQKSMGWTIEKQENCKFVLQYRVPVLNYFQFHQKPIKFLQNHLTKEFNMPKWPYSVVIQVTLLSYVSYMSP